MKRIVAWAVVCEDGTVHSLEYAKSESELGMEYLACKDCGPHRIVKLVEERKKAKTNQGGKL